LYVENIVIFYNFGLTKPVICKRHYQKAHFLRVLSKNDL